MPLRSELPKLASYVLAAFALFCVLRYQLVAPLLMGLLVFELVRLASSISHINRLAGDKARLVALVLIAMAVVGILSAFAAAIYSVSAREAHSVPEMLRQLESINVALRQDLPSWLVTRLPDDMEGWRIAINEWASGHIVELQDIGTRAGHILAQILIAMVIGAMISLRLYPQAQAPFAAALQARCHYLSSAFRNIVFAQIRISALNTFFTSCYLVILLPAFGYSLPLVKSLIVLTFFAGLLPVVGNLISNTAIVLVSLSVAPGVAASSLLYLVVIHKLEYFLNARIIGGRIAARAWELLLAMLILEAIFGLQGVVAAPVFYAYLKDELKAARQI
ncbi:MAG: family transporter [Proteobacteria bacterium]|nr:family transporter [Pseudomonadota bacterium]